MVLTSQLAAAQDEPVPLSAVRAISCPAMGEDEAAWLDRARRAVYQTICGSSVWIDHFFAPDDELPLARESTYGRMSVGGWWDEREGLDPTVRLRARIELPAFERKLRLLIGRGSERDIVEQREEVGGMQLPDAFRDAEDPVWLLGLGYGDDTELEEGWELDAGVRIRMHPDAIARAIYRRDWAAQEDTMARFRQTFFWRASRGLGSTTQATLDHMLGSRFLVRWASAGTVAEDLPGLEWTSAVSLYQDLPRRSWLSYTALVRGRTAAEVGLQDYGLQLRYRRPILRRWLFLELTASGTFPRYLESERRSFNPGVGARVEMFFGPAPGSYVR